MRKITSRRPPVALNCLQCGHSFTRYASEVNPKGLHFCSIPCRDKYAKGKPNPRDGRVSCECTQCGATFLKQRCQLGKRNFCSKVCFENYGSIPCTCSHCAAVTRVQRNKFKEGKEYFCNQECQREWQRGIIEAVATAYRIGVAKTG